MDERARIESILEQAGVRYRGIARFEDTLPLIPCRAQARLPREPRSVIVCLLGYYAGEMAHNISRYAWVRDYHILAEQLLGPAAEKMRNVWPERQFSAFSDNSPIREVEAAYLAGLGFVGKNGLLVSPRFGTYHFIAEIVTDLDLPPSKPLDLACGECRRCLDACPTGALCPDGVDQGRCRSAISQKKGSLTGWESEQIEKGGLAWGCDICNDACPYNHPPQMADIPVFTQNLTPIVGEEKLEELLGEKAFGYRGVTVIRRNLRIINPKPTGCGPDTGE